MVCEGVLAVAGVEVESREDDADGGVEGCAGGDGGVVGWGERFKETAVGAADVGDGFGIELGFDSGFAEDEDGAFVRREGQDARDVDCCAVGGAEDFVLYWEKKFMLEPVGGGEVGTELNRGGGNARFRRGCPYW